MGAHRESEAATPEVRHTQWIEEAWHHQNEGRLREAGVGCRQILRENPYHPEALHLLGLVAHRQGNSARAEKLLRAALGAGGGNVAVYCNNLANLLRNKNPGEARQLYEQSLQISPTYTDAWMNLATFLESRRELAELDKILDAAIARCPDDLRIIEARAARLLRTQRFSEALSLLKRLVETAPEKSILWQELGTAHAELNDRTSAIQCLLKALKLDPENQRARIVLSQILLTCAAPQDAEALLVEATKSDERAFAVLGNVYKDLGYMDLALDCYARGLISNPTAPDQGNFLYTLLYDPTQDHAEVAEEHRIWARTYADPHRPAELNFPRDRDNDRPLKIGYVSGHFWDHAVAMFSLPMIQAHDRERFQVILYSNSERTDWATEAFRAAASEWRDIRELSDPDAAQKIRDDEIDILVDLSGLIGGNRLLVFARKPAPIQVTYLGYQATTGMDMMDYRLTDAIADPPGKTDHLYTEKLVRLDPSFFVYAPSTYAPPIVPPPIEKNGFITFGCLNNPGKTGETVVQLWASLMKEFPESRLLLLGPSTQNADSRVTRLFHSHGIDPARIEFAGKRKRAEYLFVYDQIDICLDPFPFSGHTTTCDALWQGVSVVTLAGETYAGRMSASTLTQARFPQWIAQTREEYLQIARSLALDTTMLKALRQNMRDHLRAAPILDAAGFTRSLESAYRSMWKTWCGKAEISTLTPQV